MKREWKLVSIMALVACTPLLSSGEAIGKVMVPTNNYHGTNYQNEILQDRGWGSSYLNGALIPKRLAVTGETYMSGGRLMWTVSASVSGGFMPTDGSTSPEMWAYEALGAQWSQVHLSQETFVYEYNGEWWEVEVDPGLEVVLGLNTQVHHYVIWGEKGEPQPIQTDYWYGSANTQLSVRNGLITDSSSRFERVDYSDRPSEWWADFYFSGFVPTKLVTITPLCAVPEPATMALLGLGSAMLYRRRRQVI